MRDCNSQAHLRRDIDCLRPACLWTICSPEPKLKKVYTGFAYSRGKSRTRCLILLRASEHDLFQIVVRGGGKIGHVSCFDLIIVFFENKL